MENKGLLDRIIKADNTMFGANPAFIANEYIENPEKLESLYDTILSSALKNLAFKSKYEKWDDKKKQENRNDFINNSKSQLGQYRIISGETKENALFNAIPDVAEDNYPAMAEQFNSQSPEYQITTDPTASSENEQGDLKTFRLKSYQQELGKAHNAGELSPEVYAAGFQIYDKYGAEGLTEFINGVKTGMKGLPSSTFDLESYVPKMVRQESSGDKNAKNTKSSARGMYQFIDSTFTSYIKRVIPAEDRTLSTEELREKYNGTEAETEAMRLFTMNNVNKLKRSGLPVTELNVYFGHWFGLEGDNPEGKRVISADDNIPFKDVVSEKTYNDNPILHGKTVGEIKKIYSKKFDDTIPSSVDQDSEYKIINREIVQEAIGFSKTVDFKPVKYNDKASFNRDYNTFTQSFYENDNDLTSFINNKVTNDKTFPRADSIISAQDAFMQAGYSPIEYQETLVEMNRKAQESPEQVELLGMIQTLIANQSGVIQDGEKNAFIIDPDKLSAPAMLAFDVLLKGGVTETMFTYNDKGEIVFEPDRISRINKATGFKFNVTKRVPKIVNGSFLGEYEEVKDESAWARNFGLNMLYGFRANVTAPLAVAMWETGAKMFYDSKDVNAKIYGNKEYVEYKEFLESNPDNIGFIPSSLGTIAGYYGGARALGQLTFGALASTINTANNLRTIGAVSSAAKYGAQIRNGGKLYQTAQNLTRLAGTTGGATTAQLLLGSSYITATNPGAKGYGAMLSAIGAEETGKEVEDWYYESDRFTTTAMSVLVEEIAFAGLAETVFGALRFGVDAYRVANGANLSKVKSLKYNGFNNEFEAIKSAQEFKLSNYVMRETREMFAELTSKEAKAQFNLLDATKKYKEWQQASVERAGVEGVGRYTLYDADWDLDMEHLKENIKATIEHNDSRIGIDSKDVDVRTEKIYNELITNLAGKYNELFKTVDYTGVQKFVFELTQSEPAIKVVDYATNYGDAKKIKDQNQGSSIVFDPISGDYNIYSVANPTWRNDLLKALDNRFQTADVVNEFKVNSIFKKYGIDETKQPDLAYRLRNEIADGSFDEKKFKVEQEGEKKAAAEAIKAEEVKKNELEKLKIVEAEKALQEKKAKLEQGLKQAENDLDTGDSGFFQALHDAMPEEEWKAQGKKKPKVVPLADKIEFAKTQGVGTLGDIKTIARDKEVNATFEPKKHKSHKGRVYAALDENGEVKYFMANVEKPKTEPGTIIINPANGQKQVNAEWSELRINPGYEPATKTINLGRISTGEIDSPIPDDKSIKVVAGDKVDYEVASTQDKQAQIAAYEKEIEALGKSRKKLDVEHRTALKKEIAKLKEQIAKEAPAKPSGQLPPVKRTGDAQKIKVAEQKEQELNELLDEFDALKKTESESELGFLEKASELLYQTLDGLTVKEKIDRLDEVVDLLNSKTTTLKAVNHGVETIFNQTHHTGMAKEGHVVPVSGLEIVNARNGMTVRAADTRFGQINPSPEVKAADDEVDTLLKQADELEKEIDRVDRETPDDMPLLRKLSSEYDAIMAKVAKLTGLDDGSGIKQAMIATFGLGAANTMFEYLNPDSDVDLAFIIGALAFGAKVGPNAPKFKMEMHGALTIAKQMDRQGKTLEEIAEKTGWSKNPLGQWQTSLVTPIKVNNNIKLEKTNVLGDVISSKVFDLYPELKNLKLEIENTDGIYRGYFDPVTKTITIKDKELYNVATSGELYTKELTPDQKGTLAHEIQHAIQNVESFPPGMHPITAVEHFKNMMRDDTFSESLEDTSIFKKYHDAVKDLRTYTANEGREFEKKLKITLTDKITSLLKKDNDISRVLLADDIRKITSLLKKFHFDLSNIDWFVTDNYSRDYSLDTYLFNYDYKTNKFLTNEKQIQVWEEIEVVKHDLIEKLQSSIEISDESIEVVNKIRAEKKYVQLPKDTIKQALIREKLTRIINESFSGLIKETPIPKVFEILNSFGKNHFPYFGDNTAYFSVPGEVQARFVGEKIKNISEETDEWVNYDITDVTDLKTTQSFYKEITNKSMLTKDNQQINPFLLPKEKMVFGIAGAAIITEEMLSNDEPKEVQQASVASGLFKALGMAGSGIKKIGTVLGDFKSKKITVDGDELFDARLKPLADAENFQAEKAEFDAYNLVVNLSDNQEKKALRGFMAKVQDVAKNGKWFENEYFQSAYNHLRKVAVVEGPKLAEFFRNSEVTIAKQTALTRNFYQQLAKDSGNVIPYQEIETVVAPKLIREVLSGIPELKDVNVSDVRVRKEMSDAFVRLMETVDGEVSPATKQQYDSKGGDIYRAIDEKLKADEAFSQYLEAHKASYKKIAVETIDLLDKAIDEEIEFIGMPDRWMKTSQGKFTLEEAMSVLNHYRKQSGDMREVEEFMPPLDLLIFKRLKANPEIASIIKKISMRNSIYAKTTKGNYFPQMLSRTKMDESIAQYVRANNIDPMTNPEVVRQGWMKDVFMPTFMQLNEKAKGYGKKLRFSPDKGVAEETFKSRNRAYSTFRKEFDGLPDDVKHQIVSYVGGPLSETNLEKAGFIIRKDEFVTDNSGNLVRLVSGQPKKRATFTLNVPEDAKFNLNGEPYDIFRASNETEVHKLTGELNTYLNALYRGEVVRNSKFLENPRNYDLPTFVRETNPDQVWRIYSYDTGSRLHFLRKGIWDESDLERQLLAPIRKEIELKSGKKSDSTTAAEGRIINTYRLMTDTARDLAASPDPQGALKNRIRLQKAASLYTGWQFMKRGQSFGMFDSLDFLIRAPLYTSWDSTTKTLKTYHKNAASQRAMEGMLADLGMVREQFRYLQPEFQGIDPALGQDAALNTVEKMMDSGMNFVSNVGLSNGASWIWHKMTGQKLDTNNIGAFRLIPFVGSLNNMTRMNSGSMAYVFMTEANSMVNALKQLKEGDGVVSVGGRQISEGEIYNKLIQLGVQEERIPMFVEKHAEFMDFIKTVKEDPSKAKDFFSQEPELFSDIQDIMTTAVQTYTGASKLFRPEKWHSPMGKLMTMYMNFDFNTALQVTKRRILDPINDWQKSYNIDGKLQPIYIAGLIKEGRFHKLKELGVSEEAIKNMPLESYNTMLRGITAVGISSIMMSSLDLIKQFLAYPFMEEQEQNELVSNWIDKQITINPRAPKRYQKKFTDLFQDDQDFRDFITALHYGIGKVSQSGLTGGYGTAIANIGNIEEKGPIALTPATSMITRDIQDVLKVGSAVMSYDDQNYGAKVGKSVAQLALNNLPVASGSYYSYIRNSALDLLPETSKRKVKVNFGDGRTGNGTDIYNTFGEDYGFDFE